MCEQNPWSFRILPAILLLLLGVQPLMVAAQGTGTPTRGTRFWTGFMQNGFGAQSLRVHIMSTTATSGTVSIPNAGWSTTFTVGANNVAIVNLPTSAENQGSEVALNKGVLIQSNDSVNVFISSFQNFTHDLSQILPESSLGDAYRVDSYHGIPNFNNLHKSELLIVATQDGTQIRITPQVPTVGGNPAHVPFIVDLNAGQTYQVQALADHMDLTGTLVQATAASGTCRPFAVLGGSMCATIPGACSACDAIFEQLLPLNTWGTRYYTSPIHGVNMHTYRILAHEDNTSVTIGAGAPIMLNAGQKHEVNGTNTPVCIQSSKPVSVIQLMEGIVCAGSGDPSLVILSPHDRMSTQASFHTPTSPQLNQHSIGLVVPLASVGQVTLNGTVINSSLFQNYSGCSDRRHAKISVPAGVNRVASPAGFQLYMFGIGSGESYAASVNDIHATPVPQDSLVCGGGSTVTLNAPIPLLNAQWTAASAPTVVIGTGNSITITPTASDSYTVTGQQPGSGCIEKFTYHVGVPLTIPTLPVANGQSAVTVCQYEQVQLGLVPPPDPAWFNILWSPAGSLNDPTNASPVATPTTSTWYKVHVSSPSGCGSIVDSVFVQVTPGKVLDIETTATPAQICVGGSTNLASRTLRVVASDDFNAPPGSMWMGIQGGTISAVCGSVSGTALYFNGAGQRHAQTNALNTTGGGQVRFHLKIANGVAPCDDADPGEHVVLEYSTTNGISWNLLATYNENAYPEFTAITATLPTAAQSASTMFRLRQLANSGAGQDNWVIDDLLIARYDNTWLSYQWSASANATTPTAHSTAASPAATGWLILRGTDPAAGCIYKDSVHVTVHPAFNLQVTQDLTLCEVSGVQLNAVPTPPTQATYSWTPNNGTLSNAAIPNPMATPQSTTTYTVNAVSGTGCTATGQVTITVGQLLGLALSAANTTICQGQQVQLTAAATGSTDISYSWTNGGSLNNASIATPVATPTQTTTYTCTVTHVPSGCTVSKHITIHVTTGHTADAGNDVQLCSALGHQLGVQHNVPSPTYQWSPAANLNSSNIQSPTILHDASATYTVVVTDANGCSVSDQVVVTRAFNDLPVQSSSSGCAATPPLLTAPQTGTSYAWSTGQTTATITPSTSGPHTLTITNAQGCQGVTTFNVVLHAMPVVDLGPDVALCGATGHTLNAGNAGSTFNWSPSGGTGQTMLATSSGTYQVLVTNAHGCTATDAVNVQFNAMPVNTLQDVTACISTPPTLSAGNNGSTYLWNTGSQAQSINATTQGTYSVTVTTPLNCTSTFQANVTLMPAITVDIGNDTTICQGQQLVLNAGTPGSTYEWTTGAPVQIISVNSSGHYGVTVSNGYCSATDGINVQVAPVPADVLNDATRCQGSTIILDAGNIGSTYIWNTGQDTQEIAVTSAGTYSVLVTNTHGCKTTMDALVQFVAPPVVELGSDTVLCTGQELVLDAGNAPASWTWNTGASTRAIAVSQTGTYTVVVNNGHCERSDMINVYFNPVPSPMSERNFHLCFEEEPYHVELDAGNEGSIYQWNDGSTTRTTRVSEYGWHGVEITNVFGCSLTDSVQVVEYCPSTIFVPNTFTPNGDGINDIFLPVGRNIASMRLLIFDRWGTIMFQSDDVNTGWDGTWRGEFVTDDVYVWRLNYRFQEDRTGKLSMEKEMTGHIQVLR